VKHVRFSYVNKIADVHGVDPLFDEFCEAFEDGYRALWGGNLVEGSWFICG